MPSGILILRMFLLCVENILQHIIKKLLNLYVKAIYWYTILIKFDNDIICYNKRLNKKQTSDNNKNDKERRKVIQVIVCFK